MVLYKDWRGVVSHRMDWYKQEVRAAGKLTVVSLVNDGWEGWVRECGGDSDARHHVAKRRPQQL